MGAYGFAAQHERVFLLVDPAAAMLALHIGFHSLSPFGTKIGASSSVGQRIGGVKKSLKEQALHRLPHRVGQFVAIVPLEIQTGWMSLAEIFCGDLKSPA